MSHNLEIGPGPERLGPEWIGLDTIPGPAVDWVATWGEDPLPFPDDTFELVYASHVLEHIPWHETVAALLEVRRILKPGGTIEIWVPDFRKIVSAYMGQACGDEWRAHNPGGDFMLWVNGRIFTRGPGLENYHRAAFDELHLIDCLAKAGFWRTWRLTEPRGYDHGAINLGVRGEVQP